ncbi:MAG: bifunctional precorrin-2 dehydrogenase/sirohydrochlorin ferrochelatase [Nitrospirae bacterium]|nr:bifunctional precorrin-2 dehydrogenase/sirohydrochlorin ferrochelatase [Nitrospirota bacterium]MBI3351872.1 bifunctional precorrin-2 dehydrogenase/sirohydrochlorin ferrochelatase [Nitrospirota bacterium]
MRYYPIFVNLENRVVIVVGGGPVAERKTLSLIETGANVVLISPDLTVKLKELVHARQIHHLCRFYQPGDLKGAALVIAATDSVEANIQIVRDAESLSLFANNVTSPDHSTFIVPSVIAKKDLQIAISTSGQSPALTRHIREKLEKEFGGEYDLFIDLLSQVRRQLHKQSVPEERRAGILNKLVESDILDLLKKNQKEKALEKAKEISQLTQIII